MLPWWSERLVFIACGASSLPKMLFLGMRIYCRAALFDVIGLALDGVKIITTHVTMECCTTGLIVPI